MSSGSSRFFVFQAEDGIRDLVRSRGLGDVYKRQALLAWSGQARQKPWRQQTRRRTPRKPTRLQRPDTCLLYTSDAADERSSVDLGGRRIIKKNKHIAHIWG